MTDKVPVVKRSVKGAPLTQTELDTNWNNLARFATETQSGVVELATLSEVVDGTGGDNVVQSKDVESALNAVLNNELVFFADDTGYYKHPESGLLIQWGDETPLAGNEVRQVFYTLPYTQRVFHVEAYSPYTGSWSNTVWCSLTSNPGLTSFTVRNKRPASTTTRLRWLSLGI